MISCRLSACNPRRKEGANILLALLSTAALVHAAPLSPNNECASFQLADPSLTVELVAAEPDVLSPVAITWDARGRMFVAEMIDYPLGPTAGQIHMLEDRDRDGRYETATVFADHLAFPNSVLPWNGGLLVTVAPDLLFLKDNDGDGRADERRVLFTGFAEGNQQLRANGLLWGLDGWVYGANGRSDGEVHRPGEAQAVSLRGHDFRFRPDTGIFEAVAGRSQFGLARDDWGNRFLSWNTIPIRHEVIPERYLSSRINAAEALHDLLPAGDTGEVFPLTPAPQTFNKESTSHFNALGGLTIYRGDALPPQYRGNAFVGETLRNLVHRRVLEQDGPTFVARRAEQKKEFLASTDPWFHPVNFATGPDGALYIIDFYRQWVEHPGYVSEKMRGQVAWRTGAEHGRIWRVRSRETKLKYPGSSLNLDRAATAQLVRYLEHTNGWWRDTAQRLLVERRESKANSAIKKLALKSQSPAARLQALYTLKQLDALDDKTLLSALNDRHPRVREVAVVGFSAYQLRHSPNLTQKLVALAEDPDPRVRLQVALGVTGDPLGSLVPTLEKLARRPDLDQFTALAIRSSTSGHPWPLLQRLSADSTAPERLDLVRALASDIGSTKNELGEADGRALLRSLAVEDPPSPENALALFAGFTSGLAANETDWRNRLREWTPDYERLIAQLVNAARNTAQNHTTSLPTRKLAFTTLARAGTPDATATLLGFLLPPHDEQIQSAAVSAINESGDPALFQAALSSWNRCQIATRRKLLAGAIRSTATVNVLLDALEQGRVAPAELDASVRQNLLQIKSAGVQARVKKLLDVPTDRAAAIEQFTSALQLSGDRKTGSELFARLCAQCHTLDGRQNVGPSLAGISLRAPETLLVDILDPSRQVPSDFVSYTVTTSQGDTFTGLVMSEKANAIVLRRPGVPDETIARAQIKEVQASGRSLMPDGLEAGLTPADLANLLEFLKSR